MEVIFNADDFGRSSDINRAVIQAHREGVLTSASLMVTGDAVEEAVALARATPTLAVGLHLVLSDGRPASPAHEVPHLAGRAGRFPANPARVWIQYIFSAAARAEMAREVRAQLERFAATGLPLDHVDAHQHLHMHPAVFHALLPLAGSYGAGGVRLPRDDLRLAMRYDRSGAPIKTVWAVVFGILCRRYAGNLAAAARGLAVAGRVYGLMQSGRMQEAYVLRILAQEPSTSPARSCEWNSQAKNASRPRPTGRETPRLGPAPVRFSGLRLSAWNLQFQAWLRRAPPAPSRRNARIELYFHPSLAPQTESLGPNPGDLATLLSPAVRQAIEAHGWTRTTYSALRETR